MAEVVGLAASILQIAGAGVKLSTTLYNIGGSISRAETDIADIADDVRLTANALDNVGKVFERDEGTSVVSRKAIQDAQGLIKRCEAVFGEVQDLIDKRRKLSKDGKKLSTLGKFSWPLKEQRVELLRRRLESLKNSLMLLLHVLQLANGQAKGILEKSALDQERERIRELHQRQQESLKALHALENKLSNFSLSDDETLHGSTVPSRVPTIDFMVSPTTGKAHLPTDVKEKIMPNTITPSAILSDESETSESDGTLSEDEGEHLTTEELAQCTKHVQKLLKRINVLQQSFETATPKSSSRYPKYRVHKLYRRFCRRFESEMVVEKNEASRPATTESNDESLSQAQKEFHTITNQHERQSNMPHLNKDMTPLVARRRASKPSIAQETYRLSSFAGPSRQLREDGSADGDRRVQPRPLAAKIDGANEAPSSSASPIANYQSSNRTDDVEQVSQESVPVHYTKTGRISKAKKGLKVHTCECGKAFTRAEHLRRHQKNHGSSQVQCDLCGKVFFRADLLQRHRERHKDVEYEFRPMSAVSHETADDSYREVHDSQLRPILPASNVSSAFQSLPHLKTQGLPSLRTVLETSAVSPAVDLPSPFLESSARNTMIGSPGVRRPSMPLLNPPTRDTHNVLTPELQRNPRLLPADPTVYHLGQALESSQSAFPDRDPWSTSRTDTNRETFIRGRPTKEQQQQQQRDHPSRGQERAPGRFESDRGRPKSSLRESASDSESEKFYRNNAATFKEDTHDRVRRTSLQIAPRKDEAGNFASGSEDGSAEVDSASERSASEIATPSRNGAQVSTQTSPSGTRLQKRVRDNPKGYVYTRSGNSQHDLVPQYTHSQINAYYSQYGCYPPQPYHVVVDDHYAQPASASPYKHCPAASGSAMTIRHPDQKTWKCELPDCTSTGVFTRLADLQRHQTTVHGIGTPDFPCTVKDCTRVGEAGFIRRDHLVEHLRTLHHIDIPKRKPGERSAYPTDARSLIGSTAMTTSPAKTEYRSAEHELIESERKEAEAREDARRRKRDPKDRLQVYPARTSFSGPSKPADPLLNANEKPDVAEPKEQKSQKPESMAADAHPASNFTPTNRRSWQDSQDKEIGDSPEHLQGTPKASSSTGAVGSKKRKLSEPSQGANMPIAFLNDDVDGGREGLLGSKRTMRASGGDDHEVHGVPGNASCDMVSTESGRKAHDETMEDEEDEEEKDIVDLLLEQWTIPVY